MVTIVLATENEFRNRQRDIERVYQQAFAGFPWFQSISDEVVHKRTQLDFDQPDIQVFLAYEDRQIVGVLWFYPLTDKNVDRGGKLDQLTKELSNVYGAICFTLEKEIFVAPAFQGNAIATKLRIRFLRQLATDYPQGVILITRMRDDNVGTIKVAKKELIKYVPTDIEMPSSKEGVTHRYWYKRIN